MKKVHLILLAVSCALWGGGCVQLPQSSLSPGAELGRRYVLRTEMRACGIKADARDDDFRHVVLVGKPGIANRFIVQLGSVPAGTEFEVVGAVQTGFTAQAARELVVRFVWPPSWGHDEARIADRSAWKLYEPAPESGERRLNPEYFQRVN